MEKFPADIRQSNRALTPKHGNEGVSSLYIDMMTRGLEPLLHEIMYQSFFSDSWYGHEALVSDLCSVCFFSKIPMLDQVDCWLALGADGSSFAGGAGNVKLRINASMIP